MPGSQSFVDLRSSSLSAGSHTDDSVWPSFTDIMTVVVMIFLMSLVVILLKNVELVKSEQQAARLAELKGTENIKLEAAVGKLEKRIAQVQLQLQAQTLKTEQSEEQLVQSQQELDSLVVDIQALQLLRNKLRDENTSLAAAKLALEGRLKIVEQEKENVEALKDDVSKSNLLIEDEKQQLIVQLNAAMSEKQLLESKLSQQQSDIESLEKARQSIILQVDDLQTEKTDLTEQTQQASREVDALQTVYNVLKSDNRSLFERINDAEKMIEELEADLFSAAETIDVKEEQIQVAEEQVKSKQVALTQTVEELTQTSRTLTQTSEELSQTKVEFSQLEQKYLDLVGPARSQLNKYVVRVRYQRQGNRNIIEFARQEDKNLTQVSLPQLHQRLAQLKKQKADELYVKVVIPSDSGLSYDQAWRFTQEILNKYDYYYQ